MAVWKEQQIIAREAPSRHGGWGWQAWCPFGIGHRGQGAREIRRYGVSPGRPHGRSCRNRRSDLLPWLPRPRTCTRSTRTSVYSVAFREVTVETGAPGAGGQAARPRLPWLAGRGVAQALIAVPGGSGRRVAARRAALPALR